MELVVAGVLLAIALALGGLTVLQGVLPQINEARDRANDGGVAPVAVADQTPRAAPTNLPRTPKPLPTLTTEPTAAPSPTPIQGLVLEIEATSDSWLMVRTDGQEAWQGFLRVGESRRWEAQASVRVRTGNAGGTQITLNGQRLDPLGGPGIVTEREWRLLPDGDIEQSNS
jgi:hypothetical protein